MIKILCITIFGEICGSSRIRILQFVPYLENNNIKVTKKKLYPDSYFKIISNQKKCNFITKGFYIISSALLMFFKKIKYVLISRKYDVMIIQKDVFPLWLQRILHKRSQKIIFEFDDTIFKPSQFAKGLNKVYDNYRRKILPSFLRICNHIITENSYLEAWALKYNNNVSVITAPIDTDKFCPPTYKKEGNITLGWIGSAFTTNQLRLLVNVLNKIGHKYPNITLKLIGADDSVKFNGIKVKRVKWSLNTVIKELQSFDIGLMPLDEDPFNKGRLGYKMIQYMSVGIPTVASNTGLNKDVIINNENGFLCSNEKEWVDKISLLIENKTLRKKLGEKGRENVIDNYSLKNAEKRFLDIIKKVAEG